jgi:hypothetical protein
LFNLLSKVLPLLVELFVKIKHSASFQFMLRCNNYILIGNFFLHLLTFSYILPVRETFSFLLP